MTTPRRRAGDLEPNPEMWAALGDGALLRTILEDFYTRVYDDPRLAPFFDGVTKERAIQKQYSFLRDKFTGQKLYFGERPRNAHHWMVISDELFDHRETLMEQCLRRADLPAHLIEQWRALEEVFRKQIVKDRPVPKKIRGVSLPLDGFESMEVSAGTICDGCQAVLDPGAQIRYHVRTGKAYCRACVGGDRDE